MESVKKNIKQILVQRIYRYGKNYECDAHMTSNVGSSDLCQALHFSVCMLFLNSRCSFLYSLIIECLCFLLEAFHDFSILN